MKAFTEKLIHYLLLLTVTLMAGGVCWYLMAKEKAPLTQVDSRVRTLSTVATPKALVAIEPLQVQMCEITATYAGKIQAWETYQVGFEVAGRVLRLGENETGLPLDDGDRIVEGQVLASLDDRVFRARKSEAAARVEQANSDLQRAERTRAANPTALSESELQSLVTDLAAARAQFEIATKNLEDATLTAPVNATVSKRLVKAGETVGAHQIVFELVENDDVLLVVDVPESHIRDLEARMRAVEANLTLPDNQIAPEDREFRAHVQLEGSNRFGNPWPPLHGTVHHIPEVADSRTGLFPVEIRLPNEERFLRPGMVAKADISIARIPGYMVPESAVIFRQRKAHLFSVVKESAEMESLYWNMGPTDIYRAQLVNLTKWVDQGSHIILPASEAELESVVVRGQFRLADAQLVRVVNLPQPSPGETQASDSYERINVASEP